MIRTTKRSAARITHVKAILSKEDALSLIRVCNALGLRPSEAVRVLIRRADPGAP